MTGILAAAVGAAAGFVAGDQFGDRSRKQAPTAGGGAFLAGERRSRLDAPYGIVKARDGGSMTITSFGRDVRVDAGDSTVVSKAGAAVLTDITEGELIIVSGTTDSAGVVQADEIIVLPTQWIFLLG